MPVRPIPGAGRPASGAAEFPNEFRRILNVPALAKRQDEDLPITSAIGDIVEDAASFVRADATPTSTDEPRPARTGERGDDDQRNERTRSRDERPRATPTAEPATTEASRPSDEPSSQSDPEETTTQEPRPSSSSEPARTPTSASAEATTTVSLSSISLPTTTSSTTSPSATSRSSVSESSTQEPTTATSSPSSTRSRPTSSSATTSATPTLTANSATATPAKGGISEGAVIVASVSGTVALITIILLVVFCMRRKRQKRAKLSKGTGSDTDSLRDYPDTAFLNHSRNNSRVMENKDKNVNIIPQPSQSRRPLSISAELSQPGPSPTAMVHPPQGYTRSARVNTLTSSTPSPEPFPGDHCPGLQPRDMLSDNETAAGNLVASPTRGHADEVTPVSNRRSSVFLPTSSSHPPPIRQQQAPPSYQPAQTNYQAYKPFANRYQVPQTIPEEETPRNSNGRPSIDTASIARPYLPGEQTRSPTNEIPASLAVGPRS